VNRLMLVDLEVLQAAQRLIHEKICTVPPDLQAEFGSYVCCPVCEALGAALRQPPPYMRLERHGETLTAWMGTQAVPVVETPTLGPSPGGSHEAAGSGGDHQQDHTEGG